MLKRLLIASAALLPAWTAAAAAEDGEGHRVRVGLGAQVRPEWYGADNSEIGPYWSFDIASGNDEFSFEAPDDGFDIKLIKSDGFAAGPVANISPSRKNKDVGANVGKVPTTIEVGGFAEYFLAESFRIRAELRKGIGGHQGLVGDVGADFVSRDGDNYVFSVGPRLLFSNSRYQREFFGVDQAAATATGLPLYRPDGGLHAIAATSGITYQFNSQFGMFGYARYERLVGNAGRSPIIRTYGSRTQASAGIGLSYTFKVN
jgi:outer membrane protein